MIHAGERPATMRGARFGVQRLVLFKDGVQFPSPSLLSRNVTENIMPGLAQKRLKEVLNYDSETGIFTWVDYSNFGRAKTGAAGWFCTAGYLTIQIDKVKYQAHRLAWLYTYGYFPENNIDHINRIKQDNRIDNLRDVSQQCNVRNSRIRKDNKTGVPGVIKYSRCKGWAAQIKINRRSKTIGYYSSFTDAVFHRFAAEQCIGWEKCDPESPAYSYVKKMLNRS